MYKYFVIDVKKITATTLLLSLKKDDISKHFSYQPGQYGAISFKNNGRQTPVRCFSIASSPTDQGVLQFSIRLKGRFTSALLNLKPGDEVNVRGPFGSFVFDASRDKNIVMIAGGIGVAPFIGMMKYAAATNLSNKMTLLYSCNNQNDVPFINEINQISNNFKNIRARLFISEGEVNKLSFSGITKGRITADSISQSIDGSLSDKTFFICGPPPFMSAMVKILQDKGVSSDRIMTEAFGQGSSRQTGKLISWPNNIYTLGAIGVVLASMVIMIKDVLDSLPVSSFSASSNLVDSTYPTNSRQAELDNLVNGLPINTNNAPATSAASVQTTTTTVSTPAPAQPITPAPTATPAPVCTTSRSGVKTCI